MGKRFWRRHLTRGMLAALLLAAAAAGSTARLPLFVLGPGPVVPVADAVRLAAVSEPGHAGETGEPSGERWVFTTVVARQATLGLALRATIDPGRELVPWGRMVPPGQDLSSFVEIQRRLMEESQQMAAYAAFAWAGRPAHIAAAGAEVLAVWPGTPADRAGLRPGDVIVGAAGSPVRFADDLVAHLRERRGTTLALAVVRGETRVEVQVDPAGAETPAQMGLTAVSHRLQGRFDPSVRFEAGDVAGPSAGLAFGLYLAERLVGRPLSGPARVAATGTLHRDGSVGPVGGVRFKAAAVRAAGADVFLVPDANAEEARRAAPDLHIVGVRSLSDAVDVLRERFPADATP